MRNRILDLLRKFGLRFNGGKQWLFVLVITLCLIPSSARAAGVSDILSLLKTITSTLQGAIGGVLSEIQSLNSTVNNFRQQIVWPLTMINQARGFVTSTRAHYGSLMAQFVAIKNNSATLANPSQLELIFRGGQVGSLGQFQAAYTRVYTGIPAQTDAQPTHRNLMDMDDALATDSLKTTVLSDEATQGMLALADSLEQESAVAAPGSGEMLSTQAQVANLETQAYLAKVLASELRQEAAKLAHQNTLLKQSATSTRNLQNQMQQVLSHQ